MTTPKRPLFPSMVPAKPTAATLKSLRRLPIKKQLPSVVGLDGPQRRGTLNMDRTSKPPKLRFQIGAFVQYKGQLYEIMFAYRLRDDPHEWLYELEERKNLTPNDLQQDPIHRLALGLGAGKTTPRVVYELFRSQQDAITFFWDVPSAGDRMAVRNKNLLQHGTIVSSGAILDKI